MKTKILYDWLPTCFLIFLACLIQSHIFLERDVIYLANATHLLLQGGTYSRDFFETNPPMILFLYSPALLITKLTTLHLIESIRLYFLLLTLLSMGLCYHLLKKLFNESIYIRAFLTAIAFVLLVLPASQFAQREHLLMILVLPYVFASILQLQDKSIHFGLALLIGVLAGLGFAIKPHFLTTFALIECYFIWRHRSLLGWIRIESIAIIAIGIGYFFCIELFFADYIHVLLPFILRHYVLYIACPWGTLLTLPIVDFCFFIGILYFFTPKIPRYATVYTVLFLALAGFTLSFILTRTPWYLHVIPAVSMACLLGILLVVSYLKQNTTAKPFERIGYGIFSGAAILLLFTVPLYVTTVITMNALEDKKSGNINSLIQFFNQQPPSTFTAYSLSSRFLLLINYTPATYTGRFSLFWWQPSLFCAIRPATPELAHDKKWMVDLLVNELTIKKPDYVLVDTSCYKYCANVYFNYITEFSHYDHFRSAWGNYHYLKQLAGFKIYKRTLTKNHT